MSDIGKINAAAAALDMVKDGMVLGLGSGSTAGHFVRLLGARVQRGLEVKGVATSELTRSIALESGVPVIDAERVAKLDLAVDGADEVDLKFNLVKGGGGALLREKIVAAAADQFVVIVDESKLVHALGTFPLPVEVTPFGFTLTASHLYQTLKRSGCGGADVVLREDEARRPYKTDGGNYILDCHCKTIRDPAALAAALDSVPGVVDHGLFIGMARTVIVGRAVGVDVRER